MIGQDELTVIRRLAPDDVVNKHIERSAQIGDQRLIEAGERLRVFGNFLPLVERQPLVKEIADFRLRAGVGKQAVSVLGDLLVGLQAPLGRG